MTEYARAAIVGAGTMGVGFTQILALGGIDCFIADASPQRAGDAVERAVELARSYEQDGLMAAGSGDRIGERATACETVADAVRTAEWVIEAVPEDPAIKAEVLGAIEAAADPAATITSNTSAIPITSMAARLSHPERFLGAHWFNPPQWIPSVELIPAPDTDDAVVAKLAQALRDLGKKPTVVKDSAGFVANRIQFAMFAEAAAVVAEGVASAEDVDEIVRSSFGFRLPFYGPFAIADMAGLDTYAGAYAALEQVHGSRFALPGLIAEQIAAGKVGHKSGGGLLEPPEDIEGFARARDRAYARLEQLRDEL